MAAGKLSEMKIRDKFLFWWQTRRKRLADKRRKAWNGVSILVFRHDSAHHPRKHRINYYVLFFFTLLLLAPPLVALGLFVEKRLNRTDSDEVISNRLLLLNSLKLVTREKRRLMTRLNGQISSFQLVSGLERRKLTPEFSSVQYAGIARSNQPGIDEVTQELSELRNIRSRAGGLRDTAYFSLRMLWNRFSIHHVMPRGRPLTEGSGQLSSDYGERKNPILEQLKRDRNKSLHNPGGQGGAPVTEADIQKQHSSEFHRGVDIATSHGSPILSTAPGVVIRSVTKITEGYGRFVEIHHGLGYVTLYAHCSQVLVSEGQKVKRGQVIALVGKTGRTTGSHVHYEIRLGRGYPIDPMPFVRLR